MLYKTVTMLLQEISQVQTAWSLATEADSDFYISGFATGFYLLQLGYGVLIALFLWTFIAAVKWKTGEVAVYHHHGTVYFNGISCSFCVPIYLV
ncbi:hypothetical protein J4731_10885 [Providencia rettgeri]|nr:hypothetical protein [Providencia rettgeri]